MQRTGGLWRRSNHLSFDIHSETGDGALSWCADVCWEGGGVGGGGKPRGF